MSVAKAALWAVLSASPLGAAGLAALGVWLAASRWFGGLLAADGGLWVTGGLTLAGSVITGLLTLLAVTRQRSGTVRTAESTEIFGVAKDLLEKQEARIDKQDAKIERQDEKIERLEVENAALRAADQAKDRRITELERRLADLQGREP